MLNRGSSRLWDRYRMELQVGLNLGPGSQTARKFWKDFIKTSFANIVDLILLSTSNQPKLRPLQRIQFELLHGVIISNITNSQQANRQSLQTVDSLRLSTVVRVYSSFIRALFPLHTSPDVSNFGSLLITVDSFKFILFLKSMKK